MAPIFDTIIALLLILPFTAGFLPRPALSATSMRTRSRTVVMEIPPELEGQLDPARVWEVKFTLNGETKTVSVSEETSLLEAAEEAFEDVVYSCRAGVCNSCAGKCSGDKGSYAVAVESLSDEYVEAGYVLTCTTHATGPGLHVVLNQQEEMLGIA